MIFFIYGALLLVLLLAAFRFGKMTGRAEGMRRASVETPIRLRTQFQLEQRCPICDDELEHVYLISQDQG